MNPLLRIAVATALVAAAAQMSGTAHAFDVRKTADGCAACHGKDGSSTEADIPTIAGQSVAYLADNLAAYQGKQRPCPQTTYRSGEHKGAKTDMCQLLNGLSEDDLHHLAQHFGALPFVRYAQPYDTALAAKGKELHNKGCEKCHSDGGTQAGDDTGILAGQRMQYLRHALDEFRSGTRKPPQKMKPRIEKLDDEAVDALANFYASFK